MPLIDVRPLESIAETAAQTPTGFAEIVAGFPRPTWEPEFPALAGFNAFPSRPEALAKEATYDAVLIYRP
jgi:hypothetical protein